MHGFDYGWARSSHGGFEREGSSLLEIEGERWGEKKNWFILHGYSNYVYLHNTIAFQYLHIFT